jgi:hypothetical protein
MIGDPIDFMYKGSNTLEENSYFKTKISKFIKSIPIFPIKSKYPLIVETIFIIFLIFLTMVIWLNVFFLLDLYQIQVKIYKIYKKKEFIIIGLLLLINFFFFSDKKKKKKNC